MKNRKISLICCITLILGFGEVFAIPPTGVDEDGASKRIPVLAPEVQSRLAEYHAPVLVYHSLEKYFPCSPLFTLERGSAAADGESAISRLGTAESRTAAYEALSMQEKAKLATVYYRAIPVRHNSENKIVIEYWLYYVQNRYRARGTVIPLSFDGSHPNDLEHIHVVLRIPEEVSILENNSAHKERYIIERVYASAHEGIIPGNRYLYSEDEWSNQNLFLVEMGSHASAPDIDRDGLYTPGMDGDSGHKMLWGIRDKGATWTKYSRSYMERRTAANTIIFSHTDFQSIESTAPKDMRSNYHYSYRLAPVREIQEDFAGLGLTPQQRKQAFETDVSWFRRVLGGSNGDSDKLLLPPKQENRENDLGIKNFSSTERGFLAGGTMLAAEPGAFVGARYSLLHGIRYLPDPMLEVDGILTTKGQGYLSAQFLMTYPIDASIRLMGGGGFVTDSLRFDRRQWDWIGAFEIRLGYVRIYAAMRSGGNVTRSAADFRMAFFF